LGFSAEFLVLGWDDAERLTAVLAEKISASGYRPDLLVAVLRGGYVVARILGDMIGVDEIAVVEVKFYRGVGERSGKPVVTKPPLGNAAGRRVLVVDDVTDTGGTLQTALRAVELLGPSEIRTATLFRKPWSAAVPDYYAAETDRWIVFPWSVGEVLRDLKRRGVEVQRAVEELKLLEKHSADYVQKLARLVEAQRPGTGTEKPGF